MARFGSLPTAGVLAALAALTLGASACGGDTPEADTGVVARFGDQEVTAAELDRAVEQQIAQAAAQGQSAPEAGSPEFAGLRRQVLDSIKLQRLVDAESRKCGRPCAVSEDEVTASLDDVRKQNFDGSEKKLADFLKQSKLTEQDARRILRFSLQQPKLFNWKTRSVRFSDADARAYYRANAAQFRTPAGRTARHILVATKDEADAIRARITDENFAEIAKAESTDTGSGAEGGELGVISKGQTVPEFEKAVFSLADGEISQPVKSQFGWHIIQVRLKEASTTPFAEAKAGIVASQLNQRRQDEFARWRDAIVADWEDRARYTDESLAPEPAADAEGGAGQDPSAP